MDDDIPDAHVHLDAHADSDAHDYGHAYYHHVADANRDAIEHRHRRMLIGLHPVPGRDPRAHEPVKARPLSPSPRPLSPSPRPLSPSPRPLSPSLPAPPSAPARAPSAPGVTNTPRATYASIGLNLTYHRLLMCH